MGSISAPMLGTPSQPSLSGLQKVTQRLYNDHVNARQQPRPHRRVGDQDVVKIVCISDTHNSKPDLPQGDILLHAGDLSQYGTFAEIRDQVAWIRSLPHQHKIVIAGNHDLLLDESFVKSHPDRQLDQRGATRSDIEWGDVLYLEDEHVTVEVRGRQLSIFGTPWTPRCGSFAFQYDRSDDIWRDKLRPGIDIVLVHGPPALHLDDGKGCESLLSALHRAKPRIAVFGHIHSARGQTLLSHNQAQSVYEDIMLGRRQWLGFCQLLLRLMSRRRENAVATTLVNAAMPTFAMNQHISGGVVVDL